MQVSEFFFNMGSKCCPVAHAKLCPGLGGNCAPAHQRFALQEHYGNLDLFGQIRDTTHSTDLLHSEDPITQFGRVAF